MGGVRGDVIALGFLQTTIMEMGQPPPVQNADPAMWVKARQYTGRIVTVSNAKIFDEPIFNYTREFPSVWEEISIPIAYRDDWQAVEQMLLETAGRHAIKAGDLAEAAIAEIENRYAIQRAAIAPRVFVRMTDNWVELTVRFLTADHGVRDIKDQMSRDLLAAMSKAKIGVASGTYEITGLPPIKINMTPETTSPA